MLGRVLAHGSPLACEVVTILPTIEVDETQECNGKCLHCLVRPGKSTLEQAGPDCLDLKELTGRW